MARKPYPSDLTVEQWKLIEDLIPPAKPDSPPQQKARPGLSRRITQAWEGERVSCSPRHSGWGEEHRSDREEPNKNREPTSGGALSSPGATAMRPTLHCSHYDMDPNGRLSITQEKNRPF